MGQPHLIMQDQCGKYIKPTHVYNPMFIAIALTTEPNNIADDDTECHTYKTYCNLLLAPKQDLSIIGWSPTFQNSAILFPELFLNNPEQNYQLEVFDLLNKLMILPGTLEMVTTL